MLPRIAGTVATACLTVVGIAAYNRHHYRPHGDNPRDPDAVARKGDVEPLAGDYMRGFYYPAHGVARPGTVVVFKGSEGGNNDDMARQIRDRGYNVVGLYFFGQTGQQGFLSNVPLEFFDEVLAWIKEHGRTLKNQSRYWGCPREPSWRRTWLFITPKSTTSSCTHRLPTTTKDLTFGGKAPRHQALRGAENLWNMQGCGPFPRRW